MPDRTSGMIIAAVMEQLMAEVSQVMVQIISAFMNWPCGWSASSFCAPVCKSTWNGTSWPRGQLLSRLYEHKLAHRHHQPDLRRVAQPSDIKMTTALSTS